jgi:coenzyme F420-reducing hydrogenase delta subunit
MAAKKKTAAGSAAAVKTAVKSGRPKVKAAARFTVLLCENSAWKAYADSPELWELDAVKLPCSGKIEVGLILKLLEKGNAGVLVLGCPKDNCTYIRGNYRAEKRIRAAKAAIREAGLDENRLRFDFISSLDGRALRDVVRDFKGYLNDHSRS